MYRPNNMFGNQGGSNGGRPPYRPGYQTPFRRGGGRNSLSGRFSPVGSFSPAPSAPSGRGWRSGGSQSNRNWQANAGPSTETSQDYNEYRYVRNAVTRMFPASEVAKWSQQEYLQHRQSFLHEQAAALAQANCTQGTDRDNRHNKSLIKTLKSMLPFAAPAPGRSVVLQKETIWTPDFIHYKQDIAPWPEHAEMKWEGDDRAKTYVGRYLPLPREEGIPGVSWQQLTPVPQFEFDQVRRIPTMEDTHAPVEEIPVQDAFYLINKRLLEEIDNLNIYLYFHHYLTTGDPEFPKHPAASEGDHGPDEPSPARTVDCQLDSSPDQVEKEYSDASSDMTKLGQPDSSPPQEGQDAQSDSIQTKFGGLFRTRFSDTALDRNDNGLFHAVGNSDQNGFSMGDLTIGQAGPAVGNGFNGSPYFGYGENAIGFNLRNLHYDQTGGAFGGLKQNNPGRTWEEFDNEQGGIALSKNMTPNKVNSAPKTEFLPGLGQSRGDALKKVNSAPEPDYLPGLGQTPATTSTSKFFPNASRASRSFTNPWEPLREH